MQYVCFSFPFSLLSSVLFFLPIVSFENRQICDYQRIFPFDFFLDLSPLLSSLLCIII